MAKAKKPAPKAAEAVKAPVKKAEPKGWPRTFTLAAPYALHIDGALHRFAEGEQELTEQQHAALKGAGADIEED